MYVFQLWGLRLPKNGGPFLGVLIIGVLGLGGLHWGPRIPGHHHIQQKQQPSTRVRGDKRAKALEEWQFRVGGSTSNQHNLDLVIYSYVGHGKPKTLNPWLWNSV